MVDDVQPHESAPAAEMVQPGLKFLELAVYIMGGLLVLMFVGLIGGIAYKLATRGQSPPPETRTMALGLDPGTLVGQMVLDGDRLALNTDTEIIVIDIRKGTIVARIRLK